MKPLKCECGFCHVCESRERMRKFRAENLEHVREIDRNRYYRDKVKRRALMDEYAKRNPEKINAIKKRWSERNPEKNHATVTLNNAVRDGKVIKQPCEVCGATNRIHGHHSDYSKPLEVRWFCPKHHAELHRELRSRLRGGTTKFAHS